MSEARTYKSPRSAQVASNLPVLASDLSRSHQKIFHLRLHKNRWEFVNGKWRPIVERVHLRPGVGGVGGKGNDPATFKDLPLLQQWAEEGDRNWLIVPSGDKRIRGTCNESGDFIKIVSVQSGGYTGDVYIGFWENVTEDGQIATDEDELTKFALQVMVACEGITEPTVAGKAQAIKNVRATLKQVQSSAERSRTPGGSVDVQKRIGRLTKLLIGMTGDESLGQDLTDISRRAAGLPPREEPEAAPVARRGRRVEAKPEVEAISAEEQLAKLLSTMDPEKLAAMLAAMTKPATKAEDEVK